MCSTPRMAFAVARYLGTNDMIARLALPLDAAAHGVIRTSVVEVMLDDKS